MVVLISSNFVTVRDLALPSHFFCKELRFSYILQDFSFGIRIWFWAVENLGSNHHVSIVRADFDL